MILGIDIGGTAVKMCLADRDGHIRARHEASVSFDGYATPILTTVLAEMRAFLDQEGILPEGVGVSAAGQIDTATGTVIGTNGMIPGYEGSPIGEAVSRALGVPCYVLNDANAAALGESFVGAARGVKNALMLTLGTGVGGGIILDGRVFGGARGIAGEMGHFTLHGSGLHCTCGKRGCFELYASTTALIRRACAETGEDGLDGRAVFDRAEAGEPAMLAVLDAWIGDIAEGITGLVHIFNPEMVLIGGGVSSREHLLIAPLRRRVLAGTMPRFAEGLRLERAALGNDAGMIGAVKYYMDRASAMQ